MQIMLIEVAYSDQIAVYMGDQFISCASRTDEQTLNSLFQQAAHLAVHNQVTISSHVYEPAAVRWTWREVTTELKKEGVLSPIGYGHH